jgi:hypothetical protein
MLLIWSAALESETPITVPAVVVAEWWRGQRGPVARALEYVEVPVPMYRISTTSIPGREALARPFEHAFNAAFQRVLGFVAPDLSG